MSQNELVGEYLSLSSNDQRKVEELIRSLKNGLVASSVAASTKKTELRNESFIGIWKDRQDLEDSVDWVRRARQDEW